MNRSATPPDAVYLCFARSSGFSGQQAASELVLKGLDGRGWRCRVLPQPVLDRRGFLLWALITFVVGLGAAWGRAARRLLFGPKGWLCLNLGQTRAAFVRDVVPLLLARWRLGRHRVVISLHGSRFMHWPDASFEIRAFRAMLRRAGLVTVLGARQRDRLAALGIAPERIAIVVNTCELEADTAERVQAKQALAPNPGAIRCLYLSSLIDSKGYPEYLEMLAELARRPGPTVHAVLCGRVVPSEFGTRFPNVGEAEAWIGEVMEAINRSTRVRLRWVRGAYGEEKAELFRSANVFVLPTRYPVEAQPLVLLEAMAAGCAIVTTRVGEISTILDESCACLVEDVSPAALASVVERLSGEPEWRARLALGAHARFVRNYDMERHLDRWESLLTAMAAEGEHRGP